MKKRFLFAVMTVLLMMPWMLPCYAEAESGASVELGGTETVIDGEALEEQAQGTVRAWMDAILEYSPEEWKSVIEDKVVPWVTLAVSAVVGIYVAISPLLVKIKKTSGIFDSASGRMDGAGEKLDEATKSADSAREEIQKTQAELLAKYNELEQEFRNVSAGYQGMVNGLSNIERIVRIGFGNTDELIIKGYANEIEKVGADNGEEKEKET